MSSGVITPTGYHNRRSIRLKGYDYSKPGFYFITICIHDFLQPLFGEIIDGKMILNNFGQIVRDEWVKTSQKRDNVKIDEYVIMPNHLHGIIKICDTVQDAKSVVGAYRHTPPLNENAGGAYGDASPLNEHAGGAYSDTPLQDGCPVIVHSPSNTIGSMVRGFKGASKISINSVRHLPGKTVWQRNYYDHIIRDDRSLFRIRHYIRNNPMKWNLEHSAIHLLEEIAAYDTDESWTAHFVDASL